MKPYNVRPETAGPGFVLTYTATGGPTGGRAVYVATFPTRPAAELAAKRRNNMAAAAGRYLRATDAADETARQFSSIAARTKATGTGRHLPPAAWLAVNQALEARNQAAAELTQARKAYRKAVAAIQAERKYYRNDGRALS